MRLVRGENLSRTEAANFLDALLDPAATDTQIAAALVALTAKGETVDELAGMAEAMRERAIPSAFAAQALHRHGRNGFECGQTVQCFNSRSVCHRGCRFACGETRCARCFLDLGKRRRSRSAGCQHCRSPGNRGALSQRPRNLFHFCAAFPSCDRSCRAGAPAIGRAYHVQFARSPNESGACAVSTFGRVGPFARRAGCIGAHSSRR